MTAAVLSLALLFPDYPQVVPIDLGAMRGPSGESFVAAFSTRDGLVEVADFFFATWSAQHLEVLCDGDFIQRGAVAAFDPRRRHTRSVLLLREGEHTQVFETLAPWDAPAPAAQVKR
jgi:hypothetical protein